MEPNTIRLQENTWAALKDEAGEHGFRNRSEYIRHIIDHREAILDENTNPNTPANTERIRDRVDELEQRLADLDAGGASDELRVSSETPQSPPESEQRDTGDTSDDDDGHTEATSADSEAALQEIELPGFGDILEARRSAIAEMYALLQERAGETVPAAELKDLVDVDRVRYSSVDSFWTNAVKADAEQDRPNALKALPGVRELGNGRYQYQE